MFKKSFLFGMLILIIIPNVSYASGDECEECMHTTALSACIFCSLCCFYSAEQNEQQKNTQKFSAQNYQRHNPCQMGKESCIMNDLNKKK